MAKASDFTSRALSPYCTPPSNTKDRPVTGAVDKSPDGQIDRGSTDQFSINSYCTGSTVPASARPRKGFKSYHLFHKELTLYLQRCDRCSKHVNISANPGWWSAEITAVGIRRGRALFEEAQWGGSLGEVSLALSLGGAQPWGPREDSVSCRNGEVMRI